MNKGKLIISIIILAIVTILLILFANNWRNKTIINRITIKGNITLSESEIYAAAGLKADSLINLEELNLVFIRDRIAKHPEIKKVLVSKEPPSELIIEITEKKPIAIILKKNELFLIDEEQEIFPVKNYDKAFDLPIISGLKADETKNKADIDMAINFLKVVYSSGKYLQNLISEINMKDTTKIIVKTNDILIPFYFPRIDNKGFDLYKEKLSLFKDFIDDEIMRKNLNCEYVDLRYTNQIIAKIN